jgi:heavy-metal resistance protein
MIRSTWKALILLLAAFLVGAAVGGAVTSRVSHRNPWEGKPRDRMEGYLRLLGENLDLSSAQRDSVRAILERHRGDMDAIWQEVAPRYETMRSQIRSEIRTQLTPDQQRKYGDLTARLDQERREMTTPAPHQ